MSAMFRNLKIGQRLYIGFAIVLLLLCGAVSSTIWQVMHVQKLSDAIALDVTPTAMTAQRISYNIQGSLAALRGYMLTGNPAFKDDRASVWAAMDKRVIAMDALTAGLPADDPSLEVWSKFKSILAEFKDAQDKVEAITDPANIAPAVAMLVAEAAPRAEELLEIMVGEKQPDGTRSGGWVTTEEHELQTDQSILSSTLWNLEIIQWVLLALGLILGASIAFVTARGITKPMLGMTEAMSKLADNQLETEVPGRGRGDEIGGMASAVEVFKQNAIKVREMNAAEEVRTGQTRERTAAMAQLVKSLGDVVDAAVQGDFSRRIEVSFKDGDLMGVASSVNSLVANVDRGVSETGSVLASLAKTDLTKRVEGDYNGAFAKLKADTNAVVDNLTAVVGQ